jgi:biofilm PGA synthesis N-glycosyltransferase PgaC
VFLIELLIFLSTVFPIFHLCNALLTFRKQQAGPPCPEKEFSILIPCFNEEDTVGVSVAGLLKMNYAQFEAIYINDGSTDNTFDVLDAALDLKKIRKPHRCPAEIRAVYRSKRHKGFYVIDQQNGGKSSALNTGIAFAKADLVVTLDADSVLKKDALCYMNRAFEDRDVVAAGGAIHIMQGYDPAYLQNRFERKRGMLVTLQILEYIKGFYIYKMSLSKQRATAIISGAFGVFRKDILRRAGKFRRSLGEDIDITMRIQQLIQKTGQKILYLPEALCYTQCPENWHDLKKQRLRWQKGFIDCAVHQKRFLLKTFTFRSVSFHFLVEALLVGVCSCLFTIYTYAFVAVLAFGNVHTVFVFLIYYAFCLVFNVLYSAGALIISAKYHHYPKSIMKKMGLAILMDILFYRYFNLIMYLGGTFLYFWNRNGNHSWNKVARNKREYYAYG